MDPNSAQPAAPEVSQAPQTPTAKEPIGEPIGSKKPLKLILIIAAALFVLVMGGMILLLATAKKPTPPPVEANPSATPTVPATTSITPTPEGQAQTMKFLPGKQYYNDSISVITTDNPHLVVMLSATRVEQESSFLQYTTVNYFDGTKWIRDTISNTNTKSAITSNTIVRNWSSTLGGSSADPDVSITASVKENPVAISSEKIQNEISLLSLPAYTKLAYQGEGTVTFGDIKHPAHFVYTRAYSLNAASLAFLNNPELFSSTWLAAWDDDGNFYVFDALSSKNGENQSISYKFASKQSNTGAITKASGFDISQNQQDSGRFTTFLNGQPFDFAYLNSLNKAPTNAHYVWNVGPIDGNTQVSGTNQQGKQSVYILGIFEDIHSIK